jgi:hypothetical protein
LSVKSARSLAASAVVASLALAASTSAHGTRSQHGTHGAQTRGAQTHDAQTHDARRTVELQPLLAQARRVAEALEYLGEPLGAEDRAAIERAGEDENAERAVASIQQVLDRRTLLRVEINPESRVSVARGAARAVLVEKGWRVFLVRVKNDAGVTAQLKATSPQALPVWVRSKEFVGPPYPEHTLTPGQVAERWLDISMFDKQPLEPTLSGLGVEYRIVQLYSRDRGRREARISFNVGQGTQDIGFRNDAAILFDCLPSRDVTLRVRDENGKPTTASFIIRDAQQRSYPPKYKRLAPDFAFHPQVYRADGESIRLPEGTYTVEVGRGPEYLTEKRTLAVDARRSALVWPFDLRRWIDPAKLGWYSGDPHIHAAGCAHYEAPSQGVLPQDMMRHIVGEALNVGDVLTWGPCWYYQKQFFEAKVNPLSTPANLMRYDVEVSGFPSSHAGHLALLNLKEQDYPGAKQIEEWPTWDLPILKWAKSQGAVAGFAHSGWGLEVKSDQLPNYEMPKFDGVGANEYVVDVTEGAVDFIAGVDTPYVWELNVWYHTLNSGFRTRFVGETDFPCITEDRVGQGRTYVSMPGRLDYAAWIEGLRDGRSYVSDGRSHLMDFRVDDLAVGTNGSELQIDSPRQVRVTAKVAALLPVEPDAAIKDLPYDQKPYWNLERARIGSTREVPLEVVVNGRPVARQNLPADGRLREVSFEIPVERSSWVALRIMPSSHTNPIFITVAGRPVRASRRSAEWCLKAVDQCWSQKAARYAPAERAEAERAYARAREAYRRIVAESDPD